MYHGTYSDIQDGWVLCDGAALPADKKVADANAPNLKGRFVMGLDVDDAAGDDSESAMKDTGGFRWHGETENNHVNHDNHEHRLKMSSFDLAVADNIAGVTVWNAANPTKNPETSGVKALSAAPADTDLLNHYGSITNGSNRDTDNRPRYYVLAFIYRYK